MDAKKYVVMVRYHGTNVDYVIHRSFVTGFDNAIMLYLDLYRKWGAAKGTEGSLSEYATENPPIEDWYNGSAYQVAFKSK